MDDYAIAGPPGLDYGEFRAILDGAQSPAAEEAIGLWAVLVGAGIRPEVWLAFFHHESGYGLLGICFKYNTKNAGNVRSPEVPGAGVVIQTERGPFVKYHTWTAGAQDWAARMKGPKYAGAGLTTVRQVIPKYAPAEDSNAPESYIAAVLRDIERWVPQEQPSMSIPIREATNWTGPNRPGLALVPRYITIHETSNTNVGANAEMHRRFVQGGGGRDGVSFHWVVDDAEAVHLLTDAEVGWHAGDGRDGPGNRQSLAIETCVNADGDWARTRRNLTILVATLMHRHGIPLANVVQHSRWSGKNCPLVMRRDGLWAGQVAAIDVAYRALVAPPVVAVESPMIRAIRALLAA
jgi:hypothetical protein